MPRHASHIIPPWVTGAERVYTELYPPTPSVPHFDFTYAYEDILLHFLTTINMDMRSLWADGHLAYTLTPEGIEDYFCNRLRIQKLGDHRPEVRTCGNMFLVYSRTLYDSPPCLPYTTDPNGKPFWLIDFLVDSPTSIIVPQQLNILRNPIPLKTRLNMPIFFQNRQGGLGVSVGAAAASAKPGIRGEDMILEAIRGVSTTHFVVQWPGHSDFLKQSETRVSKEPHTIGRFAHHIGLFMKKFLMKAPSLRIDQGGDSTWYLLVDGSRY
ncbi:unnamed protein product [Peniophora sp. CBMAI 1063]|nr:unnamed protein product [Peniophora sp. CBMAI 1063]